MTDRLKITHVLETGDIGGGPANGGPARDVAGFALVCQEENEWCWASVAQAIEDWRGGVFSQSEIASRHVAPEATGLTCVHPLASPGPASRCGGCQAGCGDPHSLSEVLRDRGRLVAASRATPTFNDIRHAIDNQRPLPVRIHWNGGNGHFVCVTGYAEDAFGTKWVTVYDPLLPGVGAGPADDQDLRYSVFASAYPATNGTSGVPNFHYEVQ